MKLSLHRSLWKITLLLIGLAFLLTGCVAMEDVEWSQEQRTEVIASLEAGQTFRQGFISRNQGLNQVDIWLRPLGEQTPDGAAAVIELHRMEAEPHLVAQFEVPLAQLRSNEQVNLKFPSQNDAANSRYEVSIQGRNAGVQVLGRLEDVYSAGEASIDGKYLLGDAAFLINYDYRWQHVLADLRRMLAQTWLALPLAAVLLLPGWLLLDCSGLTKTLDWGERVAVSLGLSLATIPTLMTWTGLVGLSWNRAWVLASAGLLTALALYQIWKKLKPAWQGVSDPKPSIHIHPKSISIPVALLAIFFISLFVRFAMVRDLSAPPWVDSVHHALVTQMILKEGAFPQSYDPFMQIEAASYHPGFHSALAAFLWLSRMDVVAGMLVFGQVLNALVIFPVYLFTTTLTRNGLAGLLAALAAGLFSPMPAYYTSWGRYTQLAGLEILPAALALLLLALQAGKPASGDPVHRGWKRWLPAVLLAALAWAGLFLTHYRVVAFLGVFAICWLLADGAACLTGGKEKRQAAAESVRAALMPGLVFGVTALGLVLPVLYPTLNVLLLPKLSSWQPSGREPFSGVGWEYLHAAWGKVVTILAGIGLVWSLIKRKSFGIALVLWMAGLFVIANLGYYRLPGSGFVNSTAVTISLFLPLSTLAGYGLAETINTGERFVPARWHSAVGWGLAAAGLVVAILAARPLLTILNPVTFLVRPGDRLAIEWAADNLPPGEPVLVNPFAWGYGQYAGSDGGYWLSALAGLPTQPPPVLYGLSNNAQYVQQVNTISQQAIDWGSSPEELHQMLIREHLRFVFIGGRGGAISPAALRGSALFALRYARNGAFIFEALE